MSTEKEPAELLEPTDSKSTLQRIDSNSSYEEGFFVNYDYFAPSSDQPSSAQPPPKNKEYYFQEYPYVKPTQSDLDRKEIDKSKLFDKTKKIQKEPSIIIQDEADGAQDASILVSGFGMRNVDSFQRFMKMSQEEREKYELRKLWRDSHGQSIKSREAERLKKLAEKFGPSTSRTESSTDITTATTTMTKKSSSDFLAQTDDSFKPIPGKETLQHLDYLMGLETAVEERSYKSEELIIASTDDEGFEYSSSKSMRNAQRYLRSHRIFECFQFIVAHLLSANAENPIEFILNLLNNCVLYRSGFGNPPLLYQKPHINKLFDLMDRMQTGSIDSQQYVSGMKTFGVCSFNEDPQLNEEGMITRETFIEEVYDAELAIFNDLIKKRPEKSHPKAQKAPKLYGSVSIPSVKTPYFIPSELFKPLRHRVELDTDDQHDDMDDGEE